MRPPPTQRYVSFPLCVRVGQVVKFCARNEKASLSRTEPKAQEKKRKEFED